MGAGTWQPSSGVIQLTVLLLVMAGCSSEQAPTSAPVATRETLTPPVVEVASSPSPTQAYEPSAMPTPGPPIQFIPWPQQGDLLLPSDIEVTFEASLDDLPSGGYLLRWESRTLAGQIQAVSFPQREVTVLARVPDLSLSSGLNPTNFKAFTYVAPVDAPEETLHVLDLRGHENWRLGELCGVIFGNLSPSGGHYLSQCGERDPTPGVPPGFDVFEIISVTDGTGFRVALPGKGEREPVWLSWFGEGELIASRVWIDEHFYVCLIDVEDWTARCPYSYEDGYGVFEDVVTGQHVPFLLPAGPGPLKGLILPRACLTQGECDGIVDLGEIPGPLYLSPSGERLVLVGSGPLPEDNVAAFLEPPGWEIDRLIQLNDSYGLDAWCPDEGCILLEGSGSPRPTYRLDPDGRLTFYPYDNIIASFNLP